MAVNITIDTTELDQALDRLGGDVLRRPMTQSLALLQAEMADYPPPPSGSTYRRTGTLGRSWTSQITGSGKDMKGEVGNNVSYGPYVQDAERQARRMKHWQTDEQVARDNERRIISLFDEYLQGLADG
jgi:hypothetical protein